MSGHLEAEILALLKASPITRESVRRDVVELVHAGEPGLAFECLCSWLYEDELPLTRKYYERLLPVAEFLDVPHAIKKLIELVPAGE
ncbi:MafI family immunity protein [Actinokineospora globicatena]|uniref:MafI family immunity protein n=1 Tax=Actinokineospora globicatena TaxID=103729 RepID=A0A9W6QMD8_9PSEU|nr:MafI family immunity protein [Actinokineospora globicatena]GLW91214.1 hypothetical protein Aglo03_20300 [Actinokineospora globicatena]